MNKKQFLDTLAQRLRGFPEEDAKRSLEYYSEMIDDRIENGESEEEAVAGLGDIDSIVSQIISEASLPHLVKEKIKPKKKALGGCGIALIILGAPLWIPLIIAILAVILSLYLVIWSVVISLYAIAFSLIVSAIALTVAGIVFLFTGQRLQGILILGTVFICTGLFILMFLVCRAFAKGVVAVGKGIILGIKTAFVGKGDKK